VVGNMTADPPTEPGRGPVFGRIDRIGRERAHGRPASALRDICDASDKTGEVSAVRGVLTIPQDVIEAIATRAAEIVAVRIGSETWIGVEAAAAHLACPVSRIYRLVSLRKIPFEKDGNRLLFKRSILDEWVAKGGASR
jgi:excisionase family DNA binding protein